MNEKILNELLPIIEKTKEGLLKGIEVIQIQMPDLVKQLLEWNYCISMIWCIIGILIFLLSFLFIIKMPADPSNQDDVGGYVFGWFVCFAGGLVIVVSNFAWLKILIAPKLFLIEYISNLIK